MTNEIMFYGGMTIAAAGSLLLIAYLIIFGIRKKKLNDRLDQEYGKRGDK